jgi:uncharacterized membrane protein YgcG
MARPWRSLLLLLLTVGFLTAGVSVARADDTPSSWRISRFDVNALIDPAGTAAVTLDFDFDFAGDPGHGPYITLPLRQRIEGDPDRWRMIDVTLGQVTSPSGASAETQLTEVDGNLLIRVGSEGRTVTGVQSYRINYTMRGLIAPRQATSGLDEVNWNVVGLQWELPMQRISATVTGPAAVGRVACFVGADFSAPCDSAASRGRTATFRHAALDPGNGLQVVAGFPAGTYTGAEARLEKRYHIGNMFPITPVTGAATALLTALGLTTVLLRARRSARDDVYLGLTPGTVPAAGERAVVGRLGVKAPVAVAFTPPRGREGGRIRPGEMGTLVDATAHNVDLTATIIDLAVRGHFVIIPLEGKRYSFSRQASGEPLVDYEQHLVDTLFSRGPVVTTDDLKDKAYATLLTGARTKLYRRITTDLHWFKMNPLHATLLAALAGAGVIVLGVGLGLLLGLVGFGLLGLAGVIVGATLIVLSRRFGRRTALGSAMLAQSQGFRLYLTTAEADQIRFEEGIDVFSRYLPYAIVFGVADRWASVFETLAAQGRYTADTTWYGGGVYGPFAGRAFTSSLDRLASTMSQSMQSATAATGGGSGFSGGGGFGGGGGGGW